MDKNQRLIMIAHPRSGSTSLFQILQLHPQLNLLEEPFNEGFAEWSPDGKTYLDKLVSIPALEEQLAEIFGKYNGLKMLAYQLDDYLNEYILKREDFLFIFLRRRNLLQSVVSTMIADNTGLWHKWDLRRSFAGHDKEFKPFDISEIQHDVRETVQQLDRIEALLDQRPAQTVLKFVYEDLYFCPAQEQRLKIESIWKFLNLPPLADERIDYYLSPEKVKMNSLDTYRLIPNLQAIEDQCGDDHTGWLLRD